MAVDGVTLDIAAGEFFSLLGPSGCGKTTSLRMIAGFELPDSGRVHVAGRDITDLPVHKRDMGMVFQSYALFPHRTVAENVAFGLRMRDVPKPDIERRVEAALALVALTGLEERKPGQLSGGQQQRVALARAMVFEPRLLLLDEPLSNLDARLRVQMRLELKHLQQETGITSVFVTHDQAESMALADRIIVMNKGRIEQIGSPTEIYERPHSRFVSEFVGSINVLAAEVVALDPISTMIMLRRGAQQIRCSAPLDGRLDPGQQVLVSIRPEKLSLHREWAAESSLNAWPGRVAACAYYGDHREYDVDVHDHLLKLTTPAAVVAERGDEVIVTCDPREVVVMAAGNGQA